MEIINDNTKQKHTMLVSFDIKVNARLLYAVNPFKKNSYSKHFRLELRRCLLQENGFSLNTFVETVYRKKLQF